MKYDFTTVIDRRGKDAMAIDAVGTNVGHVKKPTFPKEGYSIIPMWVADMNFATAPSVIEAITNRVNHPLFGYFYPSQEYYDSIIYWHQQRHHIQDLKKEYIGYENGVLGCLSSAIRSFTSPGDKILFHSPAYVGFTTVLNDTGRLAELSPLKKDDQGIWRMNYEDMDQRIKEHHIHFAVLCSPHNPCGRVWEKWEIEKAMEIFKENQVIVFSDEIWSDIILEGHCHIPTYSINDDAKERTISVYAPSKTFNLAGLIGSYHIIYNQYLRDRLTKTTSMTHYNQINVLSMHSLIGAYNQEGQEWVDELNQVLTQNMMYAYQFVVNHFEGVEVSIPEGTYMLFLHCEDYCQKHHLTIDELVQKGWDVGVDWQTGVQFHDPWGVRINLALPYSLVKEAMKRLKENVFVDEKQI